MDLKLGIPLLLMAVLLAAVACGPGGAQQPSPTPTPPSGATPTPTPPETGATALVPIESVRMEHRSDGWYLLVVSGLPNGCASFKGYEARYVDGVLKVTVENTTLEGPDLACTMIYGIVETRIPLKDVAGFSEVVPCQMYSMEVNGKRYNLQAISENTKCEAPVLSVAFGQEFTLGVGDTVAFDGDHTVMKFERVIQDSRCPSDVVCVQMGDATVEVYLTTPALSLGKHALTISGAGDPLSITVEGYTIKLISLEPYPTSAGVGAGEYTATFVVTKKS